jgi:hypothetical protein
MTKRSGLARWGGVVVAATTIAGCGATRHAQTQPRARPALPHALGVRLAAASGEVARKLETGDACGALAAARRLQQQTIAAINAGNVPGALQEPLQSTVTDLAARIDCRPAPAAPPAAPPAKQHGEGHENHGKHKGHGGDEGD